MGAASITDDGFNLSDFALTLRNVKLPPARVRAYRDVLGVVEHRAGMAPKFSNALSNCSGSKRKRCCRSSLLTGFAESCE